MLRQYLSGLASILVVTVLLLGSREVHAQQLKVGYTDHGVIILNMPDYQTIQEELQRELEGGREALLSLQQDFQAEVEKYQKQQPLLSAERREQREQELVAQQQEIQEAASRKDQELAQLEATKMEPLLKRVQDAIDAVAQEQGLDIVAPRAGGHRTAHPVREQR